MGQKNENDNNKNRKYPVVDEHVYEMYVKGSKATNTRALSDAYVKFFRWATDRLQERDGIVCFVSNNSFVDKVSFDGMRKRLLQEFTQVYHLDLHGDVRKNPKLSGTTHNVFGIQVGVGITIAIRSSRHTERKLFYYRVPEFWRKTEKLAYLNSVGNLTNIEWETLQPNEEDDWLTEGMYPEFKTFLPLGKKEAKLERSSINVQTVFRNYGGGVKTNRDEWAYDVDKGKLASKIQRCIDTYNSEVDRWRRRGKRSISVDDFVTSDETKIKWSSGLKSELLRGQYIEFSEEKIQASLYRPFCKQWLYFDRALIERVYQFPQIFPTRTSKNTVICTTGIGADHQTFLASDVIVDVKSGISGNSTIQCFPYYVYNEDGTNRHENITDWALSQFQAKYGPEVTKWDILHYVYAILHHPQYRERYAENLKRELPHIPLLRRKEAFLTCVNIGKQLMDTHLHYEQAKVFPLKKIDNQDVLFSYRIKEMRLTPDRTAVTVNESLTLAGVPQECFQYRLGNRSALERVIDQYQVSEDKRSGIVSDPNSLDDAEYIVRLVGRVVTVSVETVRLVNVLAQAVKMEDWMEEDVEP